MADLVLAVAVLPVLLPVMAGIAIAIRLDSSGPVLFRQRRVGRAGVPFFMLKFRTMVVRESNDAIDDVITSDHDPRITRVGARLRQSRLDELPLSAFIDAA